MSSDSEGPAGGDMQGEVMVLLSLMPTRSSSLGSVTQCIWSERISMAPALTTKGCGGRRGRGGEGARLPREQLLPSQNL